MNSTINNLKSSNTIKTKKVDDFLIELIYEKNMYCELTIMGGSILKGRIIGLCRKFSTNIKLEIIHSLIFSMNDFYRLEINAKDIIQVCVLDSDLSCTYWFFSHESR